MEVFGITTSDKAKAQVASFNPAGQVPRHMWVDNLAWVDSSYEIDDYFLRPLDGTTPLGTVTMPDRTQNPPVFE